MWQRHPAYNINSKEEFLVCSLSYISLNFFPVKLRPSRYQLRSSQSNQLIVSPVKLRNPFVCCCWTYTIWNNLPEYLRDHELSTYNFRRQLKTFLFAQDWRWHLSALETLVPVRSIHYRKPSCPTKRFYRGLYTHRTRPKWTDRPIFSKTYSLFNRKYVTNAHTTGNSTASEITVQAK